MTITSQISQVDKFQVQAKMGNIGVGEVTCDYPVECGFSTVTDDVGSGTFGVGCYGHKSCFQSNIQGTFVECLGAFSCFEAQNIIQPVTIGTAGRWFDPGIRCEATASCMNVKRIEFDRGF